MPNIEDVNSSTLEVAPEKIDTGAQGFGTAAYHTERIYTQLGADVRTVAGDIGDAYIKQKTAQEELTQQKIDSFNQAQNHELWDQALTQDLASGTHDPDLWANSGMKDRLSQQYQQGLAGHSTQEGRNQFQERFQDYAGKFYEKAQDEANTMAVVQMAQDVNQTYNSSIMTSSKGDAYSLDQALTQIKQTHDTFLTSGRVNPEQAVQFEATYRKAQESVYGANLRGFLGPIGAQLAQQNPDNKQAVIEGLKAKAQEYLGTVQHGQGHDQTSAAGTLGGRTNEFTGESYADTIVNQTAEKALSEYHIDKSAQSKAEEAQAGQALFDIRAAHEGGVPYTSADRDKIVAIVHQFPDNPEVAKAGAEMIGTMDVRAQEINSGKFISTTPAARQELDALKGSPELRTRAAQLRNAHQLSEADFSSYNDIGDDVDNSPPMKAMYRITGAQVEAAKAQFGALTNVGPNGSPLGPENARRYGLYAEVVNEFIERERLQQIEPTQIQIDLNKSGLLDPNYVRGYVLGTSADFKAAQAAETNTRVQSAMPRSQFLGTGRPKNTPYKKPDLTGSQ